VLSVTEALNHCLSSVPEVQLETIRIEDADGRILAEDVCAPTPLPPWDNSAMDGYAVLDTDLGTATDTDCFSQGENPQGDGVVLRVLETIAAGSVPTEAITTGTCARIMTGAPLPEGATAVIMREETSDLDDNRVRIHAGARPGQHIRRRGEEVPQGSVVLRRGIELSAPAIGLCAAVGRQTVKVGRRPTVGIVSTGDEIVPPGQPLGPGQIHSSNTHALSAWVRSCGAIPVDCGIAPDDLTATRAAFQRAIACDVVMSTGGVSVGDFDVVRQALIEEGAQMGFWKVRMKPGKPLAFGIIGGRPAFGLPGNPVSCQVGFLQFVRPFLRQFMGASEPFLPIIYATASEDIRKRGGRAEFVRVRLDWAEDGVRATTTGSQSSGQQTSMVHADGLMLLAPEQREVPAGSRVAVQQLHGGAQHPGYTW